MDCNQEETGEENCTAQSIELVDIKSEPPDIKTENNQTDMITLTIESVESTAPTSSEVAVNFESETHSASNMEPTDLEGSELNTGDTVDIKQESDADMFSPEVSISYDVPSVDNSNDASRDDDVRSSLQEEIVLKEEIDDPVYESARKIKRGGKHKTLDQNAPVRNCPTTEQSCRVEEYLNKAVVRKEIDTLRVIDEVRLRRCLWDSSDQNYKDRDARISAWDEIRVELLGELPDGEKNATDKAIQQRWKTARDAYNRSKTTRKNSDIVGAKNAKRIKKYIFYDKLNFLDHNDDNDAKDSDEGTTQAVLLKDILKGNKPKIQKTHPTMTEKNNTTTKSPKNNTDKRNKTEKEKNITEVEKRHKTDTDSDQDVSKPAKRKTSESHQEEIEKETTAVQNISTEISKDDMSFFASMAPMLNAFNISQKLLFRSKVLQAAMDVHNIATKKISK